MQSFEKIKELVASAEADVSKFDEKGNKAAGNNQLKIETTGLANGAYFINLNVDGKVITQKLSVIR